MNGYQTMNIKDFFLSFFLFLLSHTVQYGSSRARGQIEAAAISLHHSHSNARSEQYLQPTLQLRAMSDCPNTLSEAGNQT